MEAFAAEAGAQHAEPAFYATPEFWVAAGFVIFLVLTVRTIFKVVTTALDDRAERIKGQIEESSRLVEEAQQLLASYERKLRDAADEAAVIVENARREADRLAERSAEELERSLKRREELVIERIAQAEAEAVAEVRGRCVDVAIEATRRLIADQVTGKRADRLIDQAIAEIPAKLH
jgi:F-type H+-transporting ATPase subunit b